MLTGGARDLPSRLQTLRGTIDWSYDLLTEEEQGLFNDLSVFSGGWTIEMALDVCSDWDVYSLLPQLVDKSLIIAEPQGDSMRYQFLETIRQYARIRSSLRRTPAECRTCRRVRGCAASIHQVE